MQGVEVNASPIPLAELLRDDPSHIPLAADMARDGVTVVPTLTSAQIRVVTDAILDADRFLGRQAKGGTGYIAAYFLPEKEVLVTGNPCVYRALRAAYRALEPDGGTTDYLVMSKPERMGVKPSGKNDMELRKHVDVNFHQRQVWLRPGIRVQAMQVLQIGPYSADRPNGTLQVVRRFHRYLRLASAAFHPITGVKGMRQSRFDESSKLHIFMPFSPDVPLAAFSLYIRMVEALSAETAFPLAIGIECAQIENLPVTGTVEDVSVLAIWEHARALVACGESLSWSQAALGTQDLHWEPLAEVASGSLVLWDSGIPHANVQNVSGQERVVSYIDFAPQHRPNGMSADVRVATIMDGSSGGKGSRAASSRRGDGHQGNDAEEKYASGPWAADAEKRSKGSSRIWARDGVYSHVCTDNLLLRALYGVDPQSRQLFSWADYEEEYNRAMAVSGSNGADGAHATTEHTDNDLRRRLFRLEKKLQEIVALQAKHSLTIEEREKIAKEAGVKSEIQLVKLARKRFLDASPAAAEVVVRSSD